MPNELAIDLSQNIQNQLSAYAEAERRKLFSKNDFSSEGEAYSSTHPDAIADGDSKGRGTGVYLDVYNDTAGTTEDLLERKSNIKTNRYNSSNQYPNFPI